MKKLITKEEAAKLIQSGMTLGVSGFGAYAAPETLLSALAERYDAEGLPSGLTVTGGITPGDNTREPVGLNRIAKHGLIDTIVAGHLANPPLIGEMIANNDIAGYSIPLGAILQLYGVIAGHQPGLLTHVGLGTFADPREEACCANEKAKEMGRKVVELIQIDGQDALLYKPFKIDACFIRATTADENGTLSMEDNATGDFTFDMAAAVHNSGGIVIAEVKNIVKAGTIHPRAARVHGSMVDYVVKTDPDKYRQGYAAEHRGELCGEFQVPVNSLEPMAMSNRKIIARRGAFELTDGGLVNLGIGMPSGIGSVANEEGISCTMSLESGPIGGVPVEGLGFAGSVNPDIICNLADVFRLYDGGMLSQTFLGAAEIDEKGNVNVSKINGRFTGPGGFINISQNTPTVCFVGTFTAGGLKETVEDGKLVILQEGKQKKFLNAVKQITFSGDYAKTTGQKIMYITERAVFELKPEGLVLTEIAPGVDLEKDILAQMEFKPVIAEDLKLMDERIFRDERMGIMD